MIIHFYLRYHTSFGQTIFVSGNIDASGNKQEHVVPLSYLNHEFWYCKIEITGKKKPEEIGYRYILRQEGNIDILDADKDRSIDLGTYTANDITIIDTWNSQGTIENIFYTKPFEQVLLPAKHKPPKLKVSKFYTHEFRVKAPLLNANEWVCITGSGKMFKEWDVKKLLPLKAENEWYTIKVNLGKEDFPLKYKYGIYDTRTKTFIYEEGSNRMLPVEPVKKHITLLHDGFIHLQRRWKGAGVAIPVFSLRSKKGFGTGEFNDIRLLVDWAQQAGIKLLQFLPVNDTTATHSAKDSYPYAAISAFALHPMYLNLDAVAGTQDTSLLKSLNKKKKNLDQQADLDYDAVMKFKISALKEIFQAKKDSFLSDINYFDFFDLNREWLVPYAAYCFLRDKYRTADFAKWRSHKTYNEDAIQKLASPSQPHYDEICFHYFLQYHLHLQLKEASDYAHKKGIILKGDIPIGVSRNSCDVWVDPSLYNLNEQAGAPPDDFAVKGQNWGFPTYNWKKMQQDEYAWWRKRLAQMNNYFDAFRIDHILGFFRIWSIPDHAVEGILGRFVPAIPIHITEFDNNRIWFDYDRYCKPYITENILQETFGERAAFVKEAFLKAKANKEYELKNEFDTQRKVEEYFKEDPGNDTAIQQGLFNLLSDVILIEEDGSQIQKFHFRILMQQTSSFQQLDAYTQQQLSELYVNYFFKRQDLLWEKEALQKLPALKRSTDMLICGEDLGMVPHCVPDVMHQTAILSLEIQRMPKDPAVDFFHPKTAPYLSVVTPSTHDMSTVREWWEENKTLTQKFYNFQMGHYGKAPDSCTPSIVKEIILQHIYSPAMWSIFQIQDLLGMSEKLRRENAFEERINQPSDPNHYWKYRMHISLEELIKHNDFAKEIKILLTQSGRA